MADAPTTHKDAHEGQLPQQEQDPAHFQRSKRHECRQQVGQHMTAQNAQRTEPQRPRGHDVQLVPDGEHVAPHNLRDLSPTHQGERHNEGNLTPPDSNSKYQQHSQDQAWDGSQEVGDGTEGPVEKAS